MKFIPNLILPILLSVSFLIGCKKKPVKQTSGNNDYAVGFNVSDTLGVKYLQIKNPFDGNLKDYGFFIVPKNKEVPTGIKSKQIIRTPIQKLVLSGASYIPMLEAINEEKSLIGFPSTQFISSAKTRKRIEEGKIKNLGNEQLLNQELLIQLNPDAIISYGIATENAQFESLKRMETPIVYFGDWLEKHPLGRAEWIKVMGLLFDKENIADFFFTNIKKRYLTLVDTHNNENSAKIMAGNFYNDYWYAPKGDSYMAQFFKDAGFDYLWKDSHGTGSLQLHMEQIILDSKSADYWIGSGSQQTLDLLKISNKSYAFLKPFKTKNVFGFKTAEKPINSVLFYELGPLRPDLILKDLIAIKNKKNKNLLFFEKLK